MGLLRGAHWIGFSVETAVGGGPSGWYGMNMFGLVFAGSCGGGEVRGELWGSGMLVGSRK